MKQILSTLAVLVLFSIRTSSGVAPESAREIPAPKGYLFRSRFSWFPDSKRIVTVLVSKSKKKRVRFIAVVNVEDESVKILSEPNLNCSYPVCSPDAKWIAFIQPMNEHSTVWVIDTEGQNEGRLVDVECWQRPAWSPDSKRLAFTSRRWDIWVVNCDGSDLTRLTSGAGPRSRPKWSPDAGLIAYERNGELWLMNPDGSDKRLLARLVSEPGYGPIAHADDDLFDWFPDGQKIAYAYRPIPPEGEHVTRNGGIHPYQIWTIQIDGSDRRCLTSEMVSCGDPACLPDGKHILFASTYKWIVTAVSTLPLPSYPKRNIWMVDVMTSNRKQLTKGSTTQEFAISPDGRKLVFLIAESGLFVLPIE